jgi:tRNA G18 (ribose-2'-O)-methylase SpoU
MERIFNSTDPRIASYRNLPDKTLRSEHTFIAEGRLLTHRLLQSHYEAESVFVSEGYYEEFRSLTQAHVPVYVAEESLMLEIVGFNFHRGALSVGKRGDPIRLEMLMQDSVARPAFRLVICPEITKPENMGLIFRSAAAFGFDGILLGERCCDPFSRRAMRVSMGAVLRMPFVKTENLNTVLGVLQERYGIALCAAVVDASAHPLDQIAWPSRIGILFGNEMDGLREETLTLCDLLATIPITDDVDSLNLGVAAGIFMYAAQNHR